MPTSEVSICNIAVSWLGGNRITSLDDDTTEANLCKLNYDSSRDATLEERNWTFATGRSLPNKLSTEPVFGFSSAFQLPSDFIRVVQISTLETMKDEVTDWAKEGDQLLVDADTIYMRYVKRISDTTKYSAGFVQALAARIAADICVPLTHDKELFANYWQLYLNKIESAGAMDGMQGPNEQLRSRQLTNVR